MPDDDNSGFEPDALAAIQGTAPKKSLRNAQTPEEQIDDASAIALTRTAKEALVQVVEGIERIEEEQRELAGHKKDAYAAAKSKGYDAKTIRAVVAFRKKDKQERDEAQALLDTYLIATGDIEFYD